MFQFKQAVSALVLVAGIATLALPGTSFATPGNPWANQVIEFTPGNDANGVPVRDYRRNPQAALGDVNDLQGLPVYGVSLGIGGKLTLKLDNAAYNGPGNDLVLYEVSSPDTLLEQARVEVSADGNTWHVSGTATNNPGVASNDEQRVTELAFPAAVSTVLYVRLTDVTNPNLAHTEQYPDGYDLNAVKALHLNAPTPTPSVSPTPTSTSFPEACTSTNELVSFNQGKNRDGTAVRADRSNPNKAVGPAENDGNQYVSLGYGGTITLKFPKTVSNGAGNDIAVYETSGVIFQESARIEASFDGSNWVTLGTATNGSNGSTNPDNYKIGNYFDLGSLTHARYVRVTDTTNVALNQDNQFLDGYDLNGVEGLNCGDPEATPTPTPDKDKGLRVAKTDNKDITRPGHGLTYVLTVENTGDVDLHDLKVTDNVPGQVSVIKIYDGGKQSGSTITWQFNLGAGEKKELRFDVRVKDNTANNHVLHNKVTAESKDHDLKDSDTDDTLVQRTPAIAAAKTPVTPVPVTAKTGAGLIGLVSTLVGGAGLAFSARRSF